MDKDVLEELRNEIRQINERLAAMEKEQRQIIQDILSGEPQERVRKRLLLNPEDNLNHKKEKIEKEIDIKI